MPTPIIPQCGNDKIIKSLNSITFALLSSPINPIPSTRIACLNLFPLLKIAGYDPQILWAPESPCEIPKFPDLTNAIAKQRPAAIVFQKIRGPRVIQCIRAARNLKIPTIWCTCDVVDNEMAREVDSTIVVTEFLRSLYEKDLQNKIHVVHDGIESADLVARSVGERRMLLRAAMVSSQELYSLPNIGTSLPYPWTLEIVGRYANTAIARAKHLYWACRSAPTTEILRNIQGMYSPLTIHTPWNQSSVESAIHRAQIGVIPIDTSDRTLAQGCSEPVWRVKSENRLTLFMGAGLPVIATPIPAYEAIIENGKNGFLAQTIGDWRRALKRLRCADLRVEMGTKAKTCVSAKYSLSEQAERFIAVVRALTNPRPGQK